VDDFHERDSALTAQPFGMTRGRHEMGHGEGTVAVELGAREKRACLTLSLSCPCRLIPQQ
jgi:hypothetical protein